MPLSSLQRAVLNVIASHRSPESVVHGGSVLNRSGLRYSEDIDIAHDTAEIIATIAKTDADALQAAGFAVQWIRQGMGHMSAEIAVQGEKTKLEWAHDSDFRFFPAIRDDEFGYILHPVDIATNKVSAAADRRVVRDAVDLMTVHQEILPLGAAVWAATGKQIGFTPEGLLAEISKHLNTFTLGDFTALSLRNPVDPRHFVSEMRHIISEADTFVRLMPPGTEGCLFLLEGKPVQPDPAHLERYHLHFGIKRGHWPSSSDVMSSMLSRGRGDAGAET